MHEKKVKIEEAKNPTHVEQADYKDVFFFWLNTKELRYLSTNFVVGVPPGAWSFFLKKVKNNLEM